MTGSGVRIPLAAPLFSHAQPHVPERTAPSESAPARTARTDGTGSRTAAKEPRFQRGYRFDDEIGPVRISADRRSAGAHGNGDAGSLLIESHYLTE